MASPPNSSSVRNPMLVKRLWVAIILLPVGMAAILAGGWYLTALVAIFMCLAAWEYSNLFRAGGFQPAVVLVMASILMLLIGRYLTGFLSADWMITLIILSAMTYHLVAYERGREQA